MPKPIKKRVKKKSAAQEEVLSFYQRLVEYYENNSRFVHLAAGLVLVLIIGISLGVYVWKNSAEKAASLEYKGFRLYSNLGNTGMDEKERLEKALKFFDEAVSKKATPTRLYYKALAEYKLGKRDDSRKTLETIIKEFPSDREIRPLAYYRLGLMKVEAGDTEGAIKEFKTLAELEGTPYLKDVALYELGRLYEELGQKEEARKYFDSLKMEYPESPYFKIAQAKTAVEEKKQESGKNKKKNPPTSKVKKSGSKAESSTQKKEGK